VNSPYCCTSASSERRARIPGHGPDKDYLILKRASASRPSGEWSDDDFDVRSDGTVVGRIMKVHATPAIRESPISSRKAGSIRGGFITRLF
jgi:hypothetical protein